MPAKIYQMRDGDWMVLYHNDLYEIDYRFKRKDEAMDKLEELRRKEDKAPARACFEFVRNIGAERVE